MIRKGLNHRKENNPLLNINLELESPPPHLKERPATKEKESVKPEKGVAWWGFS